MNTSVIIFLLFTFACLGAAIGMMIERRLNKRSIPPVLTDSSENKLARAGELEILRAWRTQAGKVWLEMDGTRLEDRVALQADQQRRLLNLVVDLRPWLDTIAKSEPKPAVQPAPVMAASPIPEKKSGNFADEKAQAAPVLKSIIEQINDVLQAKLATSVFKDRDIKLLEGPGGIVMVKDGFNKYEGVEAVPDPEIKALIRLAVTEWEKSAK